MHSSLQNYQTIVLALTGAGADLGLHPLVVDWMGRVDAEIQEKFPKMLSDPCIVAFIKIVGVHQVHEMFAAQAAGECQCQQATTEKLHRAEWFGSDFYYEDNWGFRSGILQGYEGYIRFPEYFPLGDLEFDDDEYEQKAEYDCEELFASLIQCVVDTIEAACKFQHEECV
eukprot:TRINITY_DN12234_c0_g1_i1.p1 TRINITY_DN12234_c0_g1~~TRINITY_DN12234_c0_g1_i1.p1  ORF type:complete len:170 (+),score=33.36 TRINITY_DN12234_c0_g1_i1:332-841(+)